MAHCARTACGAILRSIIALVLCALIFCGGTRTCADAQTQAQAPDEPHSENLTPTQARVADLTHEIVKKEVDLERFYLKYKLVGNKDPRWRRARYLLLQQAATGVGIGATTVTIVEGGKNLKTPSKVNLGALHRSYRAGVIGASIGAGSSAIEFGSNIFTAAKNKLEHKDPGSIKKEMIRRVREIDALRAERDQLVSRLVDPVMIEICICEGKLLKLFRDWCIEEFAEVYADVKAYQASNNVYYAMDVTANSLVGAAYLLSIKSLVKPEAAKPTAVCGLVADSFYITSAPVSTVAYKMLYNRAYKSIGKELKFKLYDPEPEAKIEMAKLKTLLDSASVEHIGPFGAHARLELLTLWSGRYDVYLKENEEQLRYLSKVALQNNISGPLISTSFLATDVMGAVAAYRLQEHPRGVNSLGFAGAISSTAGSGVSFLLTTKSAIEERKFQKHLRETGHLPEQLIGVRLVTLDELDKRLATTNPAHKHQHP